MWFLSIRVIRIILILAETKCYINAVTETAANNFGFATSSTCKSNRFERWKVHLSRPAYAEIAVVLIDGNEYRT